MNHSVNPKPTLVEVNRHIDAASLDTCAAQPLASIGSRCNYTCLSGYKPFGDMTCQPNQQLQTEGDVDLSSL